MEFLELLPDLGELRALERNCVRRRSRDGYAEVAVCIGP